MHLNPTSDRNKKKRATRAKNFDAFKWMVSLTFLPVYFILVHSKCVHTIKGCVFQVSLEMICHGEKKYNRTNKKEMQVNRLTNCVVVIGCAQHLNLNNRFLNEILCVFFLFRSNCNNHQYRKQNKNEPLMQKHHRKKKQISIACRWLAYRNLLCVWCFLCYFVNVINCFFRLSVDFYSIGRNHLTFRST